MPHSEPWSVVPAPARHTGHGDFLHPALPVESVRGPMRVAAGARCAAGLGSRGRASTHRRFPSRSTWSRCGRRVASGVAGLRSGGPSARPAHATNARSRPALPHPEVVHPPSRLGVDDASAPPWRPAGAGTSHIISLKRSKERGALLLPGSREHHLLLRRPLAVYPAKGVAEKVEWFSGAEVDDARLLFVHGQVELPELLAQPPLDFRRPVRARGWELTSTTRSSAKRV